MKMIFKSALAAAAMAGVAAIVPVPASAGGLAVSVGVAVPATGVVVVTERNAYSPFDDQYYYDPIYISGSWYHGPYRWKMRNGQRVFLVNGRWHRNEWQGRPFPMMITFRNGGHYSGGRHHGFNGADRINDRAKARMERQEDRREGRPEERHEDRQNAGHDGSDRPKS